MSSPLTWGAGAAGTGNWVGILGSWVVKPGQHTAKVELDATNTLAETTNVDNTKSFAFTPVTFQSGYIPGQKFITPIGGTPWVNWTIVNYIDLDPGSGVVDYKGNSRTYNGHDALDITLTGSQSPSRFDSMEVGVPIYAAADGVVIRAHDGMFDRNQSGGGENTVLNLDGGDGAGNHVGIDHGNGWVTWYLHMRTDSVSVNVGDYVTAGTTIGLVGSSGNSSDPHLHFAVDYKGLSVETYVNPSAYWVTPLPYAPTKDGSPMQDYSLYHAAEGEGTVRIPIYRPLLGGLSPAVTYTTQSITAVGASDFTPQSGSVSWGLFDMTPVKYIEVPVIDDDRHEPTETFQVKFTDAEGGQSWNQVWRIVDNDAILNYNATSDRLTIHGQANPFNGTITLGVDGGKIKATVDNETRYFPVNGPAGPVKQVVVNAGTGSDTVNILATPAGVTTTINGGDGSDTVVIGTPGELFSALFTLDGAKGNVLFNGGTGTNTLFLKDNSIDSPARIYTITDDSASRTGVTYSYNQVANLHLTAGSGSDLFLIQSTVLATPIAIEAGGGTDTLVGPASNNLWSVTGANAGTLNTTAVSFIGVERLNGNMGADTFSFASGGVVEQVRGTSGSDKMISPNFSTSWAITAMNGGTMTWNVPQGRTNTTRSTQFTSIENLTGGTATDTFKLGDGKGVSGQIDGGGGMTDLLDHQLATTAVSVNLATGTATGVAGGVAGIENVTGGNGHDVLVGNNVNNILRGGPDGNDILVGGGGSDTLLGLSGRDILIGGTGADKLDGSTGDDILIDGTTDLDSDLAALMKLRNGWAENLSYDKRLQKLNSLLTATTVHHDATADTIAGSQDRDWFWAEPIDTTDAILSGNGWEKVN